MRPSPGVTVLQYFLMSLAQALSSLVTLAVSFSRIVFRRSVCAETDPTDKMVSKGNNPSLASDFTVNFIERPLMMAPNRAALSKSPRRRDGGWGCFFHYPHWAKE